jgi:hypothetical protein
VKAKNEKNRALQQSEEDSILCTSAEENEDLEMPA